MSCFDCKKMHAKCKAGCCGIVPIDKEVWENNQDKIVTKPFQLFFDKDVIIPCTDDMICPFLTKDLECAIYEDRPDVCRKFGDESHPMLFCHYQDKNGKERTRQQRRSLERSSAKFIRSI